MLHLTKYGRRMRLTLISTLSAACFACLVAAPFVGGEFSNNDVGFYRVKVNGTTVGCANSKDDVQTAVAKARADFSKNYDEIIYMDPQIEVVKEDKAIATRMSGEELSKVLYDSLADSVVMMDKQKAYTVRINDYTVTLPSKDAVVELLDRVADKYDNNNEFQITLNTQDAASGTYSVGVAKSKMRSVNTDIVAAAMNSVEEASETQSEEKVAEGITDIGFEQAIEVSETVADEAVISTVDQAYEDITKENAQKTVYVVQPGDTSWEIANNNGITFEQLCELNPGMDENTIIAPGDEIVITVPKSEISVYTKKLMTYEEDYNAQIQYVDNNEAYRGTNTVIDEGTTGYREVTAEITYVNGIEASRNYINEKIITESKPKVISVGTLTPPAYIRPIYGGYVSSEYGYRWGSFHKGIDIPCSIGTPIMASADGVVIRASYYSTYGYCVDIQHVDGSMTRYAHLSSFAVGVGQTVSQGQTIAYSGNTGESYGAHLHFEVWINGTTVNPLNYVNKY